MTCTKTAIMTLSTYWQKHTVTTCQDHPVLIQTPDDDNQTTEVNNAVHTLALTVRWYAEMRLCKSAYQWPPVPHDGAPLPLHLTICRDLLRYGSVLLLLARTGNKLLLNCLSPWSFQIFCPQDDFTAKVIASASYRRQPQAVHTNQDSRNTNLAHPYVETMLAVTFQSVYE